MKAAALAERLILTMPDTEVTDELRRLLRAYETELAILEGAVGMASGHCELAKELVAPPFQAEAYLSWVQFDNPANPAVHERTTAEEIWRDCEGRSMPLWPGVGTGGTITGCARLLKQRNPSLQVVAVEPAGSAVLSGQPPGVHRIQGIGAGFVPAVLERDLIDEVMASP